MLIKQSHSFPTIVSMLQSSNSPLLICCIPINLTLFARQTFFLYQSGLFCKSIGTNLIFSYNPFSPQITRNLEFLVFDENFLSTKPLIANLINLDEQECLFLFITTNYCNVSSSVSYFFVYYQRHNQLKSSFSLKSLSIQQSSSSVAKVTTNQKHE